jgi:CheY-like chemotaxis protein
MSRSHVLVVDDLPDAADSMAALLHFCGFECDSQLSGDAALASARGRRPDIVLLDLRMPRMDGFEFLRRFRKVDGCDRVPVVMISGFSIAESLAREAGIARFFTKPVELKRLLGTMGELLALSAPSEPLDDCPLTESRVPSTCYSGANHGDI